jgi:hypothetical protein
MTEDDLEYRDSGNGVFWFDCLCFAGAVGAILLSGLIVWDLLT